MPFKPATEVMQDEALLVNPWAQEKRGKTSHALSYPRPIYYFNFDHRFKTLLKARPEWKAGLFVESYNIPPDPETDEADAVLSAFESDYEDAINSKSGTVIVDTATQLWELIGFVKVSRIMEKRLKLAEQKAKRANQPFDPDNVMRQQFDWGAANNYMSAIILSTRENPRMNGVFINRATEKYDERGGATGKYQYKGWKGLPALVDVNLELTMKGKGAAAQIEGTIGTNGYGLQYEGLVLPNPTYDDLKELFLGEDDA